MQPVITKTETLVTLEPMSDEYFTAIFHVHFIDFYAEILFSNKDYTAADSFPTLGQAKAYALSDIEQTLPEGLNTPGNNFFEIVITKANDTAQKPNKSVGFIWYSPTKSHRDVVDYPWIEALYIDADERGKGYAQAAMLLLEKNWQKKKKQT
jgi:GNAT superfamily N-acetyltransferase